MQVNQQERQLPRFIRGFIGKGHQLQQRKRQRRKVEQQQRVLANRVIFLEKQQIRAQKSLIHKKDQLLRIMEIAQRQSRQRQKKEKLLLQRQKQVEMSRQQNRIRRIIHHKNQEQSVHLILHRNSIDYKTSKKSLLQCQKKKRNMKLEDLAERKNRYMTLNLMREQGRSRIDKFFKDKNKQHTKLYEQKIVSQQQKTRQKMYTIKQLAHFQEVMRKRLQQSSLKVSQMDKIIGNMSTTIKKRSPSQSSIGLSSSMQEDKPALITSIEGELLSHSQNRSNKKLKELDEGKKVRKRTSSTINGQSEYRVV